MKQIKHKSGISSLWMPTLQSYALGEVFKVFSFTVVIMSLVFLMTSTVQFLHKGIPLMQFAGEIPFLVLYFLPFIMPVAMLAGITLGLGRMVQELEITAVRSAGIHFMQFALPVLVFAAAISVGTMVLMDVIIPFCHRKQREVQADYVRKILALTVGKNESVRWMGGMLFLSKIDRGRVEGLVYWQFDNDEATETRAKRGVITFDGDKTRAFLNMEDVVTTHFKGGNIYPMRAGAMSYSFALRRQTRITPRGMAHAELAGFMENLENEKKELAAAPETAETKRRIASLDRYIAEAGTEYHRRAPFAFATLAFALLAFPITLMREYRNRLLPFFKAFLLGLMVCFVPMVGALSFAENGSISPFPALWIGNVLSACLGVLMLSGWWAAAAGVLFLPFRILFRRRARA